jgi:hypothetical protein
MFLGDNKDMRRCGRINIMKGIHVIVGINLVRGYFPCDNFAKQAVL